MNTLGRCPVDKRTRAKLSARRELSARRAVGASAERIYNTVLARREGLAEVAISELRLANKCPGSTCVELGSPRRDHVENLTRPVNEVTGKLVDAARRLRPLANRVSETVALSGADLYRDRDKLQGWVNGARDSRRDDSLDRLDVALAPRLKAEVKASPRALMGRERFEVIRERHLPSEYMTVEQDGVYSHKVPLHGPCRVDGITVHGQKPAPTDATVGRFIGQTVARRENRAEEQRRDRRLGLKPKRGARGRRK